MKTPILILFFIFLQQFLYAQELPFARTSEALQLLSTALMSCDTVATFSTPFRAPIGLAWDGANFWANDYPFRDFIYKLDKMGGLLDSIPLPENNAHGALAFDGEYLLLVALEDGKLYKIDPADGEVIRTIQLPSLSPANPHNYGVAFDGTAIWNTHWSPGILFKVDAVSGDVVASFDLPVSIGGILATPNYIFGFGIINNNYNGPEKLYTIDKSNGIIIDSVELCGRSFLDMAFDGTNVWAYTFNSSLPAGERLYQFDSSVLPLLSPTKNISKNIDILSVFPNPTYDQITISTDHIEKINVIDAWGKSIPITLNDHLIDLSAQPPGVYFIIVDDGDSRHLEKVVKL